MSTTYQRVAILSVAAMGIMIGLAILSISKQEDITDSMLNRFGRSRLELTGPAGSLIDMVESADAILIGEVDSVDDSGLFAGYNGDSIIEVHTPTPNPSLGSPTPPPLAALPYVDLLIDDENVLKNDASNTDWILRMVAEGVASTAIVCSDDFVEFPPGDIGERYMFFVSQNPDGSYGLHHGPYDRIILGSEILYSDCDQT